MCVGCWLRQSYPPSISSYIHHPSVLPQEVVLGGRGGEEGRSANGHRTGDTEHPLGLVGSRAHQPRSPVPLCFAQKQAVGIVSSNKCGHSCPTYMPANSYFLLWSENRKS